MDTEYMGTSTIEPTAHAGQPQFTLLAQDISAPSVVKFWIIYNQKLQELARYGMPVERAIEHLNWTWHLPPLFAEQFDTDKLKGALQIMQAMEHWQGPRKVAD